MSVVVENIEEPTIKAETSRIAGFNFGLKTFLTCSEGFKIESPQLLKQSLNKVRSASKQLSKKLKSSQGSKA